MKAKKSVANEENFKFEEKNMRENRNFINVCK